MEDRTSNSCERVHTIIFDPIKLQMFSNQTNLLERKNGAEVVITHCPHKHANPQLHVNSHLRLRLNIIPPIETIKKFNPTKWKISSMNLEWSI